jgi:hypothetical protein
MSQILRFAANLAVDVAGYSLLIGADESGTLQGLKAIRAELIDPPISKHNGPPPGGRRGDINRSQCCTVGRRTEVAIW